MKKLIAMLLAIVMVLSLAACGAETPDPTDAPQQTQGNDTPDTPEVTEPAAPLTNAERYPLDTDTVLRVLYTEDGLGDTDASALWTEITGVQIENLTWNNEQMMTSLAAGDIPDAIVYPWNFPKDKVYEYGAAGKFLDFKPYLDKMPNLSRLIEQYPEIMDVCTYPDGAMYSLPKVGWSTTGQSNLFYIRMDLVKDMGWDHAPATTDEFLTFIKEAQAKYGADNPEFVAFMPTNNTYMEWNKTNAISLTLFSSFGELIEPGLTLDNEGNVVLGAATEQYKHYLEFMHEVWESGAFEKEIYTLDAAAGKATIQNGNCVIAIGTHASPTEENGWEVTVMEPLTSQWQPEKQWMKNSAIGYLGFVANANCKDLDTLLAFCDSFYAQEDDPLNDEGTVWAYSFTKGVHGVHWTKDDEAMTWTSGEAFSNYYSSPSNGVGDFLHAPTTSLKVKGEGTLYNVYPYHVLTKGVANITLSVDDQDTFADIWTDMNTYIGQMHGKFISGEEDIEAGWDAYIKNLEKMGLEELLEIYQNTIDAK